MILPKVLLGQYHFLVLRDRKVLPMDKILIGDIAKLRFLSSPVLCPSGGLLAYKVTGSDLEKNDYTHEICIADPKTGASRTLSMDGKAVSFIWDDEETLLVQASLEKEDEAPAWAPKTTWYRVNAATGERKKAFAINGVASGLQKIQNGLYGVVITVDRNAPDPDTTPEDVLKESLDYHVIEEAPLWENGRGYIAGKRNTLFLFNEAADTLQAVTGPDTELSFYCVSPDGSSLAVIGKTWKDTNRDSFAELYLYDIASGVLTTVVAPGEGKVRKAAFLGSKLIYTFTDNTAYGFGQLCDFWVYDPADGSKNLLCAHGGLAVGGGIVTDISYGGGCTWKTVGGKLYFVALEGYVRALYSLDIAGSLQKVCGFAGGSIEWFDTDGSVFWMAAAEKDSCIGLYRFEVGMPPELISDTNEAFFSSKNISPVTYCPFTNADGILIDGWVIKPVGFDPENSYPALFEIHGGPRAAFSEVFMHEMQVFAAKGYFVFFCNPRGSEGRGEDFADIRGRHGTIDYDDLMAFCDHVLAQFPQIDPKRVAAAGGSYAGFMCNWIEGHTDRFAAIASQRSVSEFVEDFCVSDIGYTYDLEAAGGDPWNDTTRLWERSPYKYAPFAKTPILFIHSLCDYDCTIDQGVSMFQAMKWFGVPARMCLFEGENHELSRSGKPRHRIRRLQEIADWLDRYCCGQ